MPSKRETILAALHARLQTDIRAMRDLMFEAFQRSRAD